MLCRPTDVDTCLECYLLSSGAILNPATHSNVVNNLQRASDQINIGVVAIVLVQRTITPGSILFIVMVECIFRKILVRSGNFQKSANVGISHKVFGRCLRSVFRLKRQYNLILQQRSAGLFPICSSSTTLSNKMEFWSACTPQQKNSQNRQNSSGNGFNGGISTK